MRRIKEYALGVLAWCVVLLILGAAEPLAEYVATGEWPNYQQTN